MLTTPNPFAPITPAQETALAAELAKLGRNTGERIRRQARGISAGEADTLLARLRGEPIPESPRLEMEPRPGPANPAAVRQALREKLDRAYAGFAMCHSPRRAA